MNEFFINSTYFGVVLSLLCYWGALKISAKVKSTLVNPLCVACAFIIAFLLIFKIGIFCKFLDFSFEIW